MAEPVPERYFTHEAGVTIPKEVMMLGCVFFFEGFKDTPIPEDDMKKIVSKVNSVGGEIETTYSPRVTHIVTDSQAYPIVKQGLQEGKRVVSLYWLNEFYREGKMMLPNKAWHLPKADIQPRNLLSKEIIATTGFSVDERASIQDLCLRIGCKYTSYMSTKNTVLIVKKVDSEKYNKALDWLIPVVSGQWITDAFLGVNNASTRPFGNHQRHKRFDAKSEPFELDLYAIRHLMVGWRTPLKVSEEQVKEALDKRKKDENSQSSNEKSSQDSNATEIVSVSSQETIVQSSQADQSNPSDTSQVVSNSEPLSQLKRTSENSNDEDIFMKPAAKKPKISSSPIIESGKSLTNGIPPPPPLTLGENVFKVLLTGIKASDQPKLEEIVKKLGAKLTLNPTDCTHVVVEKPVRTTKFLSAMSHANYVVCKDWVFKSGMAGRFLSEHKFSFAAVAESLKKRQAREGDLGKFLFNNMVFFITPGVIPSPSVIKPIIESAGGIAVTNVAPNAAQLKKMSDKGLQFVVISTENDGHLCETFFKYHIREYLFHLDHCCVLTFLSCF